MAFTLCGMDLFADNRSHVFFGALTLVGALFVLPKERKQFVSVFPRKNLSRKGDTSMITYHYYTCMYKGSDAFWTIQFACNVNEIAQHKSDMIKWADSVRV